MEGKGCGWRGSVVLCVENKEVLCCIRRIRGVLQTWEGHQRKRESLPI